MIARTHAFRRRERGVALLVAIVMFAIATTIAAALTYNKAMAARRAAATFTLEQALQAGMAAEALAAIALEDDAKNTNTLPSSGWAQPLGPVEIEGTGIWIAAQLEDLNARFNLNSLVMWDAPTSSFVADPHQLKVFSTILSELDIDTRYADLMADWIDTDMAPLAQGGEDSLYLSQTPPYRTPNTFIFSITELLALPNFGAENYAKLAPHVTALLPHDEPINVCTATGLVLDAANAVGQQQYQIADLKRLRAGPCWPPLASFSANVTDPQVKAEVDKHVKDAPSQWFRLRTNIRVGTAEFVLYSVLNRETNNKVRTVRRTFGSE